MELFPLVRLGQVQKSILMFDILKFEILSFRTNEILKIWSVEHLVCRTFDFSKFWYFVQIRTTDGRNFGVRKIGFRKNNVAPCFEGAL
jgi:hypothetical protein